MNIIKVKDLTKVYNGGHGIFNISLEIKKGEVFGYLGPNGAGKTTTIRHLLGFIKSDSGTATIDGLDIWSESNKINSRLGYIPGEIAMPEFMSGTEFIKYIFNLRKLTNWQSVQKWIDFWEFDPEVKIKKMSKGMKQKVGLVIAFMHNPDFLILDEPTSGLDPLMQDRFIKLIQKSKKEGKTIILSSHIFAEIEKTCDRVAIIKNGKLVSLIDMKEIIYSQDKTFEIIFDSNESLKTFKYDKALKTSVSNSATLLLVIKSTDLNDFIKTLSKSNFKFFREIPFTLEEYFMNFYQEERGDIENV